MKHQCTILCALIALWLSMGSSAPASSPTLKWVYEAKGTLYAPPLVADVHPTPGRETIFADAEVRLLRCVDATGKQLWEYRGGWTKRLTSGASLSRTALPGQSTLLIGGGDGRLCCLDAETGKEHWTRMVGPITWGTAIWADLDGDGRDEAVAGTEHALIALDPDGKTRWTYQRPEGEPPLYISTPIAACDIDGDGRDELFAADRCGIVCLTGTGTVRWRMLTGTAYFCGPVVADADHDGKPELYCGTGLDSAVLAVDAQTGKTLWEYPAPPRLKSLAMGDLDRDGFEEIVVADDKGRVHALSHAGKLLWYFQTEKPSPAEITLGDIDGDGDIEVLVTGEDHYLYCLDSTGRLEWRYQADKRLQATATITDVDMDGKTDILFGGSDHRLRCITLGGAYAPGLIPWPSRRFDAAQTGAIFPRKAGPSAAPLSLTRSLFVHDGGFEWTRNAEGADRYPKNSGIRERRLAKPRGWHVTPLTEEGWNLDTKTVRSGKQSVRIAGPMTLLSAPIAIEQSTRAVRVGVYGKGPGAIGAVLRWSGTGGVLREDALKKEDEKDGWRRFALAESPPPSGARWVTLLCKTTEQGAWWDDAEVIATISLRPQVDVLVNQVGYDIGAPKRFTVQSRFKADEADFSLLRDDGTEALSGPLEHAGRIKGCYGHDWGYEYYRGDFSTFDGPGHYRLRVTLSASNIGEVTDLSWPFEIGADLVWVRTARPAYRFFYYQRCGQAVPGYHGPCHLDDGITYQGTYYNLSGGWHDAGDYNTYHNAPYVYGLARAYGIAKVAFDREDQDNNGRSDFLDEILWGGDHSRRMIAPDGSAFGRITSGYGFWGPPEIETDNKPRTGDERPVKPPTAGLDSNVHLAAMAKIARYAPDKTKWIEAAERALRWSLAQKKNGVYPFSAAVDLYAATQDKKYAALAHELFPKITASEEIVDAVQNYDTLLGEDHSAELRKVLVAYADNALKLADNPFGVLASGTPEKPNFFGTVADGGAWRVGTNSRLAGAVSLVAMAYQYQSDPRYLAFAYDQINWILGNNPYDVSLMEGSGSDFVPTYHNRIAFAGIARGAIPGSIINGLTWYRAGEDLPYLDMTGVDIPNYSSNECWLPHNTHYLNALANLKKARHPENRRSEK